MFTALDFLTLGSKQTNSKCMLNYIIEHHAVKFLFHYDLRFSARNVCGIPGTVSVRSNCKNHAYHNLMFKFDCLA